MKGIENIGSSLLWVQAAKDSYPTGRDITYMKPQDLSTLCGDRPGRLDLAEPARQLFHGIPRRPGDVRRLRRLAGLPAHVGQGALQAGRPISQDDVDQRRRVVVLGMNTARAFFPTGGGGPGQERDLRRQGFHGDRRDGEEGAFARG